MKKTITLSLICGLALAFADCSNVKAGYDLADFLTGKTVVGNGVLKEKVVGRLDFHGIDSNGSIDVVVSSQSDAPVKISGDENLLDLVDVSVHDGVLTVRHAKNVNYSSKKGLRVIVPNSGQIRTVTLSGSADLTAESPLTGDMIAVSCKGSSDFRGDIHTGSCNLDMRGSSDFRGSLKVENVNLKFAGSSDFHGSLEALNANFDFAGSSDCVISGSVGNCRISMSGSSDFKGYDFTAGKADCNASGSSDIRITCSEEITVHASGSSDVYYRGSAKVAGKTLSGSSSLRNR